MMQLFGTLGMAVGSLVILGPVPGGRHVAPAAASLRLVVASSGNEARYRVREQLAGIDFPSDAIGVTQGISGQIEIGEDGQVVRGRSHFTINVAALKSDRDMRDGYIRRRTLQTDSFPTVTLVPTELRGLPSPIPTAGALHFTLVGDLTVRGVTRPTTWEVNAEAVAGGYKGTAVTRFTFDAFEITKPRVARVLSVEDTITLEYDFHLVPPE